MYCCPEKPYSSQVGGDKLSSKVLLPALLHNTHQSFPVSALIDSGAAINIIDSGLVEKLRLPTIPCVPLLRVTAITNQPIGEGFLFHHMPPLDLQIGLFH
ncbi:hypothetical protein QTP86_006086 [Hemibagrus guttatus]|nr:hypothetical protein QTP86_006086 [Hemibagrus guttatus]